MYVLSDCRCVGDVLYTSSDEARTDSHKPSSNLLSRSKESLRQVGRRPLLRRYRYKVFILVPWRMCRHLLRLGRPARRRDAAERAMASAPSVWSADDVASRFTAICAVVAASLVYARVVAEAVQPGVTRLACFLPSVLLHVYLPLRWLNPADVVEVMYAAVAIANFGWWTNFKLLAFAFDRGQLARRQARGSLLMFLAAGGLPVVVKEHHARERRTDAAAVGADEATRPRRPEKDMSASASLLRMAGKVATLSAGLCLIPRTGDDSHGRHVLYAFCLYAVLGVIMDGAAFAGETLFGLTLEPHFDKPYLASSAADFWGRRWNLAAGAVLRDLLYSPIVEGSMLPTASDGGSERAREEEGTRPGAGRTRRGQSERLARKAGGGAAVGAPPKPSVGRRAAGATACFVASGLAHEGILWYLNGMTHAPSWEWFLFFTAQGPLVTVEWCLSEWLARNGRRVGLPSKPPWLLAVFLTLGIQFALADWFFWGPVVRTGLDKRIIDNIRRTYSYALVKLGER